MLVKLFQWFSTRARMARAELLKQTFPNLNKLAILDLGGGDGSHISKIIEAGSIVTVADIDITALARAERSGFRTLQITDSGSLPLETQSVDLIFCSSVIEHVTLPKVGVWEITDGDYFRSEAWKRQKQFAGEIRRCARNYFVQTPHRFFPIESHTWLPVLIVFLPRSVLLRVLRFTNRFWPKKTSPDWRLLTASEMAELFPDADIVVERVLGFPKSIMAIGKLSRGTASAAAHPSQAAAW